MGASVPDVRITECVRAATSRKAMAGFRVQRHSCTATCDSGCDGSSSWLFGLHVAPEGSG